MALGPDPRTVLFSICVPSAAPTVVTPCIRASVTVLFVTDDVVAPRRYTPMSAPLIEFSETSVALGPSTTAMPFCAESFTTLFRMTTSSASCRTTMPIWLPVAVEPLMRTFFPPITSTP